MSHITHEPPCPIDGDHFPPAEASVPEDYDDRPTAKQLDHPVSLRAAGRRRGAPMRAPASRADEIAVLYASHQRNLERIVNRQVRASGTIVEDACQTAWTRLCAHPDVTLEEHSALSWLVTTATRKAWKRSEHLTARETPAGAFRTTSDVDPLELAEPATEHASPSEVAIAHAEHAQRVEQLRPLTDRERLYLYLQGLGYSYTEMAQSTQASRRTVERQVLRARAKLNAREGG